MKIAFITGGLRPGRDGVGDYTGRLAAECIRQGHSAIIVGWNDAHVAAAWFGSQVVDETPVPVLRLPRKLPWRERAALAGKWLEDFNPDWISLQFVAYAFHPKGLVYGLGRNLAPLLRERNLHMMFHEIWLCKEQGWGWRQCLAGAFQRRFIQSFVRTAKPAVIHTSNALYAAILQRNGIPAAELGLFGNVPVLSRPGTAWIESQLRKAIGENYRRKTVWLFGFFGALHAHWPPEPLLGHLQRAAQAAGKRPVLLSIGRVGDAGLHLWNRMARDHANHFSFLRLGEQPVKHISEYLSFIDCGIATTPRSIIGKSGTVVAMLEHGLPVIVNRDDAPRVAGFRENDEPLLLAGDSRLEECLQTGVGKGPHGSRRERIAHDFLASLRASTPDSGRPSYLK